MKVLFVGNQGGEPVLAFYLGMAPPILQAGMDAAYVVWKNSERAFLAERNVAARTVSTFEDWVAKARDWRSEVDRLVRDYPSTNWWAAIAAERSFTDYCLLIDSTGIRVESHEYVQRLLVNIVTLLEQALSECSAVVCQTADTLFSYCVFEVARAKGVEVFAVTPAALLEAGAEGGSFTSDVFRRCPRMERKYVELEGHVFTVEENQRLDNYVDNIIGFTGETPFFLKNKGVKFRRTIVTPQLRRIVAYLFDNHRRSMDVEYIKIDPWRKARANVLRFWRRWQSRPLVETVPLESIPEKSVFLPLHFQPEQTTIAQGIYYANQISLVENLSKSLPFGYTLIVKEHPIGRGTRPSWQYRYLAQLPNVEFCDAPAKVIVSRVQAVVTITGSIAVEAMVMDKPAIVLGRTTYSYCELFYKPTGVQEFPALLRDILVGGHYERIAGREHLKRRFLLSYLQGMIPRFPFLESAEIYGASLLEELAERRGWAASETAQGLGHRA